MAPNFDEPLPYVPLVPEEVLRRHHVLEPHDHRFRAAARLLQGLWREDRELPIGHYRRDGKRHKLGSRISAAAGRAGGNFMMPAIAALARRELAYREPGAMIDEHRLATNLLSSMPLAFNVFGLLRLDLKLAARVVGLLFPELGKLKVGGVWFEHSPGRGDPTLTGDYSAFDVFIRYATAAGRTGFIAIEVKYSESCQERLPTIRPRYDDLAPASGLFVDPDNPALRQNPYQQCFREHLLAQAMLMRGDYGEGRFVVIAPRLNTLVETAVTGYRRELAPPTTGQARFAAVALEDVIAAIARAGEQDYAARLFRRYCDFWLVDGELEIAWAGSQRPAKSRKPAAIAAPEEPKLLTTGRA